MMRWLWRGGVALLAMLVFLLALILYWPAADWLPRVLPSQVQVDGVSGSLREGRIEHVRSEGFSSGPWQWRWSRPTRIDIQLGETDARPWTLHVHGWPWQWRAVAHAGDLRWWQEFPLLVGALDGTLQWRGQWQTCQQAQGQMTADSMLLLVPYPMGLGRVTIGSTCAQHTTLSAQAVLPQSHDLKANLDVNIGRGKLTGQVVPESQLGQAMQASGLIKRDQRNVDLRF